MVEASLELLVLAPPRDAELTCRILASAAIRCVTCASAAEMFDRLGERTGAVVLAEETLHPALLAQVTEKLVAQEPWSDLPFIVIAQPGHRRGLVAALTPLGNVSVLHRPMVPDDLASAVAAALRARRRQLQIRGLLEEQREQSRLKDEFLAMLAHELRNPLAPVRYAAQILQADTLTARLRKETAGVIDRQIGHMSRIIDELLDATRVVRGMVALACEPLDLRDLVRASLEGYHTLAERRGLRLSAHMPEAGVVVEVDRVRMRQVIDNLMDNAVKFSAAGGEIRVTVGSEAAHAVLRVRDSGVGLEPGMVNRIFEPFVQAGQTIDRQRGGLGLGLAVARSMARLHGGEILAESPGPGKGSEFTVHLPLSPKAPARPAEPGACDSAGRPLRIMVAEDNLDSAESLKLLLELSGHDVRMVHTGIAAVEETRRTRPDVLICDIGLPGLSGLEVAKRLRDDPALAQIGMIAVTGYGSREDRAEALAAGFDDHLPKPVDPALLMAHIERSARRRAADA